MRTNPTKLFDDLVAVGANPTPSPQDEINAKVAELENKLTEMIESKLSNITAQANATESTQPVNISQKPQETENTEEVDEEVDPTPNNDNKGE